MSKQSKTLIVIGVIVLVFVLVIIFWPQNKIVVENKIIKTISTSVVIIPTQNKIPWESTTGAKKEIMSDDQYKLMSLINILRDSCPITNDYFEITYDYKIDKFIVTISNKNMETFLQWKNDTGYNGIADKYFVIKND